MALKRIKEHMIDKDFTDKVDNLSKAPNEFEWTATEGQLTYVLPASASYDPNSKWLEVSLGGAPVAPSLIEKTDSTKFKLLVDASVVKSGMKVVARWVEPFIPAAAGHGNKHELGGQDEIDLTKMKGYDGISSRLEDIAVNINRYSPFLDGVTSSNSAFELMKTENISQVAVNVLLPKGVYYIDKDLEIPEKFHFIFAAGAIIKLSEGVTFTFNGTFEDTHRQIFDVPYDPVTVTLKAKIVGLRKTDHIRPEWFGETGKQKDSDPLQKAILVCYENEHGTVLLNSSIYVLDKTVELLGNLTLKGNTLAKMLSQHPNSGSMITGLPNVDPLFMLSNKVTNSNSYGLLIKNVRFKGDRSNGVKTAILSNVSTAPARPVVISESHFTHFENCLFSDNSETANGGDTGIAQVIVEKCTFYMNIYSVRAKGRNAIMDLDFRDNVSEQGGRLLAEKLSYSNQGSMGGSVNITDNLLEGQSDAVNLYGGNIQVVIERNYFEANSGDTILISASHNSSQASIKNNFISSNGVDVKVRGVKLSINGDGYNLHLGHINAGSEISVPIKTIWTDPTTSSAISVHSEESGRYSGWKVPITPTKGSYYIRNNGMFTSTSLGSKGVTEIIDTYGVNTTIPFSVDKGQVIVATALMRAVEGGEASVGMALYDQNTTAVTSGTRLHKITNKWSVVTMYIEVPDEKLPLLNSFKFRWHITGKAQVTDTFIYIHDKTTADGKRNNLPSGAIDTSPLGSQATISANQTQVVVNHTFPIIPKSIDLIPLSNPNGYLWVSDITTTSFTINCSNAPSSDLNISWTIKQ